MIKNIPAVFALLLSVTSAHLSQIKSASSCRPGEATNRRPTGALLDPAGRSFDAGNMPLAIAMAPEGDRVVLSLNGWRQQGLQVIDRHTGSIAQTISQPGAFLGLAFSKDGSTLYASGGGEDVVYQYSWLNKQATLVDTIVLEKKDPKKGATRYPAGIALSGDGRHLFVAENLSDSLAVVDLESKQVVQRLQIGLYPYDVVTAPDGAVYVSCWGGNIVSVLAPGTNGSLTERGRVTVGRHP